MPAVVLSSQHRLSRITVTGNHLAVSTECMGLVSNNQFNYFSLWAGCSLLCDSTYMALIIATLHLPLITGF